MQVKIKRSIMLGGKTYRPGVHDVPDGDLRGWFAEALLASGAVESLQKAAEKPQEPAKEPEATPAAPEPAKARKTRKKAA